MDSGRGEPVVLVEAARGPLVDTVHRGSLATVDVTGRAIATLGEPREKRAYWRSSAKPFQSMPLVYSGAAERFGLDLRELAICCGSHNGEPEHTELVLDLLGRIGLDPAALDCGIHPPLHPPTAQALTRDGGTPTPLHHNCSGLQAGMLILAVHLGAGPDGYADPDHPVQREVLENVARFTGLDRAEIVLGVDGCNVPTFGISIERMALAYARLMQPDGILEQRYVTAAVTIRDAMTSHPFNVAGTGRLDTELMAAGEGRIVSKGGAGGVQCVGVVGGTGLAVKLDEGEGGPLDDVRPKAIATLAALRQLELFDHERWDVLTTKARPSVTTATGAVVGVARPAFELAAASA